MRQCLLLRQVVLQGSPWTCARCGATRDIGRKRVNEVKGQLYSGVWSQRNRQYKMRHYSRGRLSMAENSSSWVQPVVAYGSRPRAITSNADRWSFTTLNQHILYSFADTWSVAIQYVK